MALIKYQYNKTSLNDLNRQLKMRVKALPTIKSKESALRAEVKKAKTEAEWLFAEMERQIAKYSNTAALWNEFDASLIAVEDVELHIEKIAGVQIPVLDHVIFQEKPYSLFSSPFWFHDGIRLLKDLATIGIKSEVYYEKMRLLEHARKKTTQKVNLYEKVQIPGYNEAIRKIKRFMEDEENLSKAAQKIVKVRQQQMEEDAA
ncbi:MAG: V-type ATP synthase subunit D [Bacteroidales bacterium]|nr:V-type ATP synthase subunit D [Bacteroidales bacterium]